MMILLQLRAVQKGHSESYIVFVNQTFLYEFSNSICIILQLNYICDLPVVSLVHVAICTTEVCVFGNFLDCQRYAFTLLNSCKFLYFLSLLSIVLIVTSVVAALYIPPPTTQPLSE